MVCTRGKTGVDCGIGLAIPASMTTTTKLTTALRTSHRITMAQLVRSQKAARAALREEQRLARAQQMAAQKTERDALRQQNAGELADLRAALRPSLAPAMPAILAASLGKLEAELADDTIEAEDFELELAS